MTSNVPFLVRLFVSFFLLVCFWLFVSLLTCLLALLFYYLFILCCYFIFVFCIFFVRFLACFLFVCVIFCLLIPTFVGSIIFSVATETNPVAFSSRKRSTVSPHHAGNLQSSWPRRQKGLSCIHVIKPFESVDVHK
jgi:hypothetical protein